MIGTFLSSLLCCSGCNGLKNVHDEEFSKSIIETSSEVETHSEELTVELKNNDNISETKSNKTLMKDYKFNLQRRLKSQHENIHATFTKGFQSWENAFLQNKAKNFAGRELTKAKIDNMKNGIGKVFKRRQSNSASSKEASFLQANRGEINRETKEKFKEKEAYDNFNFTPIHKLPLESLVLESIKNKFTDVVKNFSGKYESREDIEQIGNDNESRCKMDSHNKFELNSIQMETLLLESVKNRFDLLKAGTVASVNKIFPLKSTADNKKPVKNKRTREEESIGNGENANIRLEKQLESPFTEAIERDWNKDRLNLTFRCTLKRRAGHEEDYCHYIDDFGSWSATEAKLYQVRTGPDYMKYKNKISSSSSLYNVVMIRCFSSDQRTANIIDLFPLPAKDSLFAESSFPKEFSNPETVPFPQVLIMHFQLPFEAPNPFRPKDDGFGGEIVVYLRPSSKFISEMKSPSSASAASKLFQRFAHNCSTSYEMRKRLKCVGIVDSSQENLEHLASFIDMYNGQPLMVSESSSAREGVCRGIKYLEIKVNVHAWSFITKKGLTLLLPALKHIKIDVGFMVEAIEEDEMPECVLGNATLNNLDITKLVNISSK